MEQGRDGTGTRVGWQLQEDSVRQLRDHLYWLVEAHPRAPCEVQVRPCPSQAMDGRWKSLPR
jgi:hypothetical protein